MPQYVNQRERLAPRHPREKQDRIRATTSEVPAALMLKQLSCLLLAAVSIFQTLNEFVLQQVPGANKEQEGTGQDTGRSHIDERTQERAHAKARKNNNRQGKTQGKTKKGQGPTNRYPNEDKTIAHPNQ